MKLPALLVIAGVLGLGTTILFGANARGAGADDAQTTYFASGQIETRVEYQDGRREGAAERWYADGTLQSQGRYEAGRMEGEWRFWNADGSLDAERSGTYRAGVRTTDASERGS